MKSKSKKLGRRDFVARLGAGGFAMVTANLTEGRGERIGAILENESLRLAFDGETGLLVSVQNKLTNESMMVRGDDFAVVAEEFTLTPQNTKLEFLEKKSAELVEVTYRAGERTVITLYKLGKGNHFFEKFLLVTSGSAYRLRTLVVSKLRLSGPALKFVNYAYPEKTAVSWSGKQNHTFFGRSVKGGVFLGLELPFDACFVNGKGTVQLGYNPSLKVRANERMESEPIYIGVYKRGPADGEQSDVPLSSESEAMVGMTSVIMGPPRHGLAPMACGWWCEFEHETFQTEAQVEADMRSIDVLAECGVDWVTDSHPWSGETDKMNALGQEDHYQPGLLVRRFLEHAREKKVRVVFWPTMNNTHPWWKEKGRPFRPDQPGWLMFPEGKPVTYRPPTGPPIEWLVKGNCLANEPFFDWLMGIQFDGMRTGYFGGWVMDGDFFGGGGIVLPVNCPSGQHDHLPGDSNYGCERALNRMMAKIRESYPDTFIGPMCRPPEDLGIWSNRLADAVFTLDEFGLPQPLRGLSRQPINVTMGDKLRRWSRVRVHHQFFPHYMDQPLVFAAPKSMKGPDWPSEKIDYVMLSALSSSPTQLYYLPTKAGIPAKDKAEIRKWLDWGRKNIRYLQVRKDLPQWPEAGKVDGNTHIIEDGGLIFLFNPNLTPLPGRFRLDRESLGITKGNRFEVAQTYPVSEAKQQMNLGQEVVWEVPAQTAIVLSISRFI